MTEGAGVSLLTAALRCRCPRCGKGALYQGLLTVRPSCPACGLDLAEQDAGDGAVVPVILVLGAVVVLLALIVESIFAPPMWLHLVLWTPFTLVGAILLMRPIKAGLIAQQYRVRSLGRARD